MQVRWLHAFISGSGARTRLGIDDITISSIPAPPALTDVIIPQYAIGHPSGASAFTDRVPYAFRATINGLTANATYRYLTQATASAVTPTAANVRGNSIFANLTGAFTATTAPSLSTAGRYGTFVTSATGTFTGWFVLETTEDAIFNSGGIIKPVILLNDGGTGTTAATVLATTATATVLEFGTTSASATQATGVYGNSAAPAKSFVLSYANTAGTGRPLYASFVEDDGADQSAATGYRGFTAPSNTGKTKGARLLAGGFYANYVNTVTGGYGLITPNANASGIQRLEQRALADGTVVCANTDTDGIWPSGTATVNPASSSTTPLIFTATDAPLAAMTTAPTFSPSSAAVAGATVTVTGNNFVAGATTVTLNSSTTTVPASAVTVTSATTLTFQVPAGAHGTGTLTLTAACNALTSVGSFTVTPVVTVSTPGPLDLGTTPAGTAGITTPIYTVSGTGLAASLVLNAPTGVEISSNAGATYSTTLSFTPTAGAVATQTITVRIAASATADISANITNISGTSAQNVSVTGTVTASAPAIAVTPGTLNGFTYPQGGGPSASQFYNLSASNLTPVDGNLSVGTPANYEVSLDNSAFAAGPLLVPYTGSSLASTKIYVRLKAGRTNSTYSNEKISNSGGGVSVANAVNVIVNGSVSVPVITITGITGVPVCATADATITVNFTNTGAFTGAYTVQLSNVSGTYTSATTDLVTTLASAGTLTAVIPAGTASGTAYKVRVLNNAPSSTSNIFGTAFTIVSNPTVSVAGISPQALTVGGSNGTVLTATEAPIAALSRQWSYSLNANDASPTSISGATALSYTPAPGTFPGAGTYYVSERSTFAGCGVVKATPEIVVNVSNPSVTITSLTPSTAIINSGSFTLTVAGTGFVSGVTTLTFDGTSYTTTVTSLTSLTASIPNSAIASTGPKTVVVTNPAPGGGTASAPFTVTAQPLVAYSTIGLSGFAVAVNTVSLATNITASTITRGSDLSAASITDGYNSSNWTTNTTLPTTNDYITFSMTVASGYQAAVNDVTIIAQRTAAGPKTVELIFSADGTNFSNPISLGTGTLTSQNTSYTLPFTSASPAVQAMLGTGYFRLYGYNASSTGNLQILNLTNGTNAVTVNGTVSAAIPGVITVSTTGLLNAGTTMQQVPSTPPVSYTVSGTTLGIQPLVVQAPAGFQVSTDAAFTGITTDANQLSLTPSSGTVPPTTIYVRLSGSGTVSTMFGSVVNTSGVSPSKSVAITGKLTYAPARISVAQAGTTIVDGGSFAFVDTKIGVRNTQTFTVSNTGGLPLNISGISSIGTDFGVVGTLPTVVPGFSSATFAVYFEPTATGVRTGTITLASNGENHTSYVINLTGKGIPSNFVRWTGAGGNNSFFTSANWSTNTVPGATDDVLLDHSTVTGAYDVSLSVGTVVDVTLQSLTVKPGGSAQPTIELVVPASNTRANALIISPATGQPALSIYAQGIVSNRSGASTAPGIAVAGTVLNAYIYNGGIYRHATVRSSSDLTENLSGVGGTENGTFIFDVTPSGGFSIGVSLGGRNFGNLTFTNGGTTGYIAGTGNAIVNGTFTIDAGTQFEDGLDMTLLRGNVVNSGNVRFTGTAVSFNGQAPQIISGAAFGGTIASGSSGFSSATTVQINNPTGVTLNTGLQINGTLDLLTGLVTTNSTNSLTIPNTAVITGGNDFSFVNGPVVRPIATVGAGTMFSALFPVGKLNAYRPITLAGTQGAVSTYTAEQFEGNPGQGVDATLKRVSFRRSYTVKSSNVTTDNFSGKITLSFGNDDFVNVPSTADLVVAKRDQPALWTSIGHSVNTGPDSGAGGVSVIGTLTSNNFSDFSDFVLGSLKLNDQANSFGNAINPLPVELTSFGAQRQADKTVAVSWTTASEKNSAYFEVQRSLDGQAFAVVATATAQGTSSRQTSYSALDKTAPGATLYYRLRQVDLDGTANFSPVVTVIGTANAPFGELTLYPNPTQRTVSFAVAAPTPYRVLNQLGQVLLQGTTEAGVATVEVSSLQTGVYHLELQTKAGRVVRKFVKE